MTQDEKNPTLEEQIAMAARGQAASPESAAALVRCFAELSPAYVFCSAEDLSLLDTFTGDIWEKYEDRIDTDTYRGFCTFFDLLIAKDSEAHGLVSKPEDVDPYRPMWGTRMNNAMVLLGEMLLDQAMGRRAHKEVYHCLHQALGQYLDALEGPPFHRGETEAEGFQLWKGCLLRDQDPCQPMAEVLVDILRRYEAAFHSLDRLDHILTCLGGLALHLETLGTRYDLQPDEEGISQMVLHVARNQLGEAAFQLRQALRRYGIGQDHTDLPRTDLKQEDPLAYFLNLAQDYMPNLPDPGEDMEICVLRTQLFLPYRAYGLERLQQLAEQSPEDFRNLLAEYVSGDTLTQSMRGINGAVGDLYMLFVEPYLNMAPPEQSH